MAWGNAKMMKALLCFMLLFLSRNSQSATDIPIEVRQSHLTFKDGSELLVSSDGSRFLLVRLSHEGVTQTLRGDVFSGLFQPDLATMRLRLVAQERCGIERSCFRYSLPLIEISVAGIPEDPECLEECSVQFLFKDDRVLRKTISRKAGMAKPHLQREFFISDE